MIVPGMMITVSPHWIPMYASVAKAAEICGQFVRGIVVSVSDPSYDMMGRRWMLVIDASSCRVGWVISASDRSMGLMKVEA